MKTKKDFPTEAVLTIFTDTMLCEDFGISCMSAMSIYLAQQSQACCSQRMQLLQAAATVSLRKCRILNKVVLF